MNRFIHVLILLLFCNLLSAQQMAVKSFSKRPMDMDAKVVAPRKDQNGDIAALIKISTIETGFNFNGGMMGIVGSKQMPGEIWLYLTKGIQRLTIGHPQLGMLRDYFFPEPIEEATVYEMVLTSGRVVTIVEESAGVQFFVLRYTPADIDIDVYFDDDIYVKGENGIVSQKLKYGRHTYKIQAPRYKQVDGVVEIGAERANVDIALKSSFGYVNFTSQPNNGASVYINDEFMGTTPFTKELEHGEYRYRITAPRSFTVENSVIISKTRAMVDVTLVSTHIVLNITSQPIGASVYINDEFAGTTPLAKGLERGEYNYRISMPRYRSVEGRATVGETQSTVNVALISTCGYLNFTSQFENGAEVYINGEYAGTTPFISKELAEGVYNIEVKSTNYLPHRQTVTVLAEGTRTDVMLPQKPNFATVNIIAGSDSDVYINDVRRGDGSLNLRLTPGYYTIEARKSSHRTTKQTIEVVAEKNQSITLTEPTPIYGTLEISANAIDAKVFLNGKQVGITPDIISKILIGTYDLEVSKEEYTSYKGNITINEGKITTHSVTLSKAPIIVDIPTVHNIANPNDRTVNMLDASLIKVFGAYYANAAKKVKVTGTLNNADFTSLQTFEIIDLSDVIIVGRILTHTLMTDDEYVERNAIPSNVFLYNDVLRTLILPNLSTVISYSTFSYAYSLENIIIPQSVTRIYPSAFSGCSSLTNIIIPQSVYRIGSYAFSSCSSLTNIIIPQSVTKISWHAFDDCTSLSTIEVEWVINIPEIDKTIFENVNYKEATLIIPKGTMELYEKAKYWKKFNLQERE